MPAPTTGLDLKVLRIRRGITATAMAPYYGGTRQTVTYVEMRHRVTEKSRRRYLAALDAAVRAANAAPSR